MRIDGFVSAQAPLTGGELVTKPLLFSGNRLTINFATSVAGSLRAEIQDQLSKAIEGFSLADCSEIFGDRIEQTVTWKLGSDVGDLAGSPIRLRIELKDAELYSFRFGK